MKFLNLSFGGLMLRSYLMMTIIIIAGFSGMWFLSILALPIFFRALMGIQFKWKATRKKPDFAQPFSPSSRQHQPAH